MSWSLEGEYFENCNCKVVCPCEASMSFEADNERCQVPLICHIERARRTASVSQGSTSSS